METTHAGLHRYQKNIFSEFGEDGILEKIFELLPPVHRVCCEFGASDGIAGSNTRQLVLNGWTGIMIEGDPAFFTKLAKNYALAKNVHCLNEFVDSQTHDLSALLHRVGLDPLLPKIEFLSVDIDGLDYEIFESLNFSPMVISIEVNPGFSPTEERVFDREMAKNIGQPLSCFSKIAEKKGYALVCLTPNAIYIRRDLFERSGLPALSDEEAYHQLLASWPSEIREWMFLNNLGAVHSFKAPYQYRNSYLTYKNLGIHPDRMAELLEGYFGRSWQDRIMSLIRQQNELIEQRDYWQKQHAELLKKLEHSERSSFRKILQPLKKSLMKIFFLVPDKDQVKD